MRNKFLVALALITMFLTSTCWASIPESELYIGGIGSPMTSGEVRDIYGDPYQLLASGNNHALWKGDVKSYAYGEQKSFKITFVDDKVIHVMTTANNGLRTPAGIGVKTEMTDVLENYGEPDDIVDETRWFYHIEENEAIGMVITFDKETNKVKEIRVGNFDT